ncbi:MAG: tail fiber domain-containing protein [Tepidisphaeraceae bacterium]
MAWYNPLTWGEPDKKDYQFQHQGQIQDAINRGLGTNNQAPQVGLEGGFRDAQSRQLQQLQGIASGQQQGAGELAIQRQVQNALASQQGMARMARGSNAGLAARDAASNAAAIGLSGAGQSQQAAMQDQMNAQGLIAQVAGQGRGQDIQTQVSNMDAQLKAMGMNDAARIAYLQQLTGMDAAQLQAYTAAKAGQQQMTGALISGAGQIGATALMSDENVKTDVADADEDIDAMLDALRAKRYRYKDETRHGRGERAGIMAQDLERSRAGRAVVTEVADGKSIDVNKAVSAALASVARLNQRLRKVEAA